VGKSSILACEYFVLLEVQDLIEIGRINEFDEIEL
jgi:hypothetical protein